MQLAKGAGKDILRSVSVNRLCSICLKTALTWQKCSAIILPSKHLVILAQLIFMAVFKAVGVWQHGGLALRFKMPFLLGIQTSLSSCLHPGKVDLMLFAASDSRLSWTKAKPPRVWLFVSVQKHSLQQNWEGDWGGSHSNFLPNSHSPCSNLQPCACLWDTPDERGLWSSTAAPGELWPAALTDFSLLQSVKICAH